MPVSPSPCAGVPLEGGVLPLSQSSVTRALSQRTLSTLLPGAVQMTFCAASDPSGKPGPVVHDLRPAAQLREAFVVCLSSLLRSGSPADPRIASLSQKLLV